jgi:TRAP-type mannitol/chloroaromatic compound transport system permease small subunit
MSEETMERVLRVIDRMSEWTGKAASFLVAILTLAICYDVFMRYVFDKPTSWAFEMGYMIYGVYAILGAAYCHLMKGHVRMDLLYGRLSPRGQARMDAICYLFLFYPLFFVLIWKCGEHALWSWSFGERSSVSVWRPWLGPFKMLISIGFVLFFLQGTAEFIRSVMIGFKGEPHES